jgi:hypothetical protein
MLPFSSPYTFPRRAKTHFDVISAIHFLKVSHTHIIFPSGRQGHCVSFVQSSSNQGYYYPPLDRFLLSSTSFIAIDIITSLMQLLTSILSRPNTQFATTESIRCLGTQVLVVTGTMAVQLPP